MESKFQYDAFVSHSSKDKASFVRPLVELLRNTFKLAVWFDEGELKAGDKLRREIAEAIKSSRFGIAVLSPNASHSPWVQREIDSLVERDNRGEMRIIPVYHNLAVDEAQDQWPLLSSHVGVSSEQGIETVAEEIAEAVKADASQSDRLVRFSVPGELLPFLVNREEQDCVVEGVIHSLPPSPRRPVVCLVHGDEDDCPDMYVERLAKHSLGLMAPDFCNAPIKKYPVIWPEHLPQLDDLHDRLARELHIQLNRGRAARSSRSRSRSERSRGGGLDLLNRKLARFPGPVILFTEVTTSDLADHGEAAITRFLDFWEKWPDLRPNQRLIVFLLIEYGTRSRLRFFNPDSRINRRVENFITEEEKSVDLHENVHGELIPRLHDISKREVENWIARELQPLYPHKVPSARKTVRLIFEKSSTLPLEDVAQKLSDILFRR